MLYLVGLMGMLAVGATVFMGDNEQDAEATDQDGMSDKEEGDSPEIIDIGTFLSRNASESSDQGQEDDSDETPSEDSPEDRSPDPDDPHWGIQQGTAEDDQIEGTEDDEFLLGYAGDDEISGNGGTDSIEGGAGEDTLSGGANNDVLHGEDGDDQLAGDDGDDTLFGHSGNDLIEGDAGHDSLVGGQGHDIVDGGSGDDVVRGYHGDDDLFGGQGQDTLFGDEGADSLSGLMADGTDDDQTDFLNGGAGDDVIIAGAKDVVTAGEGLDTVIFGDWIGQDEAVEITDYEADEDNLVMLYDANEGEPHIDVEQDTENAELYHVLADGVAIAEVHSANGLTVHDIALIAQANG